MRRVRPRDRRHRHRAALPQRLRSADAARHAVRRRGEHLPLRAGGRRARRRCSRTAASCATSCTSRDVARANLLALAERRAGAPTTSPAARRAPSSTWRSALDRRVRRARPRRHRRVAGGRRPPRVRRSAEHADRARLPRRRGLRRRHARVRGRAAEGIASAMPRFAVVGHVEWIEFARVPHVPSPGEIVHATEWWEEVGGGGAVAAVQLAKLAGGVEFFTALAEDERGRRSQERLEEMGVTVYAAPRPGVQRRGFVYLDDDHERTITILGERIVAHGDDDLPWERLERGRRRLLHRRRRRRAQAVAARAQARRHAARLRHAAGLAGQPRRARALGQGPRRAAGRGAPRPGARPGGLDGGQGGRRVGRRGPHQRALEGRRAPRPAAGRLRRRRLVRGRPDLSASARDLPIEKALEVASRCGAHKLAGRAPYDNQLTAADL